MKPSDTLTGAVRERVLAFAPGTEFSTKELYGIAQELRGRYPKVNESGWRATNRCSLQRLRNEGEIIFVRPGIYKRRPLTASGEAVISRPVMTPMAVRYRPHSPKGSPMQTNVTPLPSTPGELVSGRIIAGPTVIDQTDDIVVALWANEEFRKLVNGLYDEDSVEGSTSIDDTMAAIMIREHAIKVNSPVATKNLAAIVKALRRVLRRYNVARVQRAGQGGE